VAGITFIPKEIDMRHTDDDNEVVVIRNIHITDKDFIYNSNVCKDVMKTCRKLGWIPPTELKRMKEEKERSLTKGKIAVHPKV